MENSNPLPESGSKIIDEVIQNDRSNPFPLNSSQKLQMEKLEDSMKLQSKILSQKQNLQQISTNFHNYKQNQQQIQNQNNQNPNQKKNNEVQFLFFGNKAGLENIDKKKIQQVIYEASKDSDFYKKQEQKKKQYDKKVEEMKQLIEQTKKKSSAMRDIIEEVDTKIANFEQQRTNNRIWMHFDIDMFFIACEIRDNPSLKDVPCCVGSSIISTANYVARKYGVRSAMPGFIAKKLCPELVFIKHNGEKYREASKQFKSVLEKYDPEYESMGSDEANLDMTNYLREHNITQKEDILKLCTEIRTEIFNLTQLTVSCGIGPNKMLAKLGTDMNKPNGQTWISGDRQEIIEFMGKQPVRKVPGIGNVCEQILTGLGIENCSQIIENKYDLRIVFQDSSYDFFVKSSLGIARAYHEIQEDRKSISVSRTFKPISNKQQYIDKIKELSIMLSDDLKSYEKLGKHIQITFKSIQFNVTNRSQALDKFTNDPEIIAKVCNQLLMANYPNDPLRLMGIKMGQLIDHDELKKNSIEKFFKKSLNKQQQQNKIQNGIVLNTNNQNLNQNIQDKQIKPKLTLMGLVNTKNIQDLQISSNSSSISDLDKVLEEEEQIKNQKNIENKSVLAKNKTTKMKGKVQPTINEEQEDDEDIDIDELLKLASQEHEQELLGSQKKQKIKNNDEQNRNINNNTNEKNRKIQNQQEPNIFKIQQQVSQNNDQIQQQQQQNNNSQNLFNQDEKENKSFNNILISVQNQEKEQQLQQQLNQQKKQNNILNEENHGNFEQLQQLQNDENSQQNEKKAELMMEDVVPRIFTCFICNKEIDCMANITRMNNHINQCLAEQDQPQLQENIDGNNKNSSSKKRSNWFQPKNNAKNQNQKNNKKANNNKPKQQNKQSGLQGFFKKQ